MESNYGLLLLNLKMSQAFLSLSNLDSADAAIVYGAFSAVFFDIIMKKSGCSRRRLKAIEESIGGKNAWYENFVIHAAGGGAAVGLISTFLGDSTFVTNPMSACIIGVIGSFVFDKLLTSKFDPDVEISKVKQKIENL